ncbi:MAG: hypothetical protein ABIC95_06355 [archaeon]
MVDGYGNISDIEKEVAAKLRSMETDGTNELDIFSGSYKEFKEEERKEYALNTFFERYCKFASGYLNFFKLKDKTKEEMQESIDIAGFTRITPEDVLASSVFTLIAGLFLALPFFIMSFRDFSYFLVASGMFMAYAGFSYPAFFAQITKMKAQEESILAILYITIYMRVSPVLENGMYFAIQHLNGPLGKDIKAMLWMLDMGKASSVETAMKPFMDLWIKRNPDFVKAFLTLHSVLDQDSEAEREKILEKSLHTILDNTFIKMKHYSHDLKTPVLLLHTFGMMLPLIGLIAFPMVSVFMSDSIRIEYLFFGYIVVLPLLLFFLTKRILAKRPGAFSFPDLKENPYLPPEGMYMLTFNNKRYYIPVFRVAIAIGIIIMLPGIAWVITHTIPETMMVMQQAADVGMQGVGQIAAEGEYTFVAMMFTLLIPLGLALTFSIYFYFRSIQRLRVRNSIVEIEEDLDEALFQLGQQFTDEVPIEIGLQNYIRDAQMLNLKQRSIFHFFKLTMDRIQEEGVTFSNAVFDKTNGIIIRYPSILMQEIMWIVVEGTKKGAKTLYTIMTKISVYLNNTKKIKELIYDLLTETVSSINVQAKFFSPFLSAIVGSLTFIIVQVLWQMAKRLENIMKILNFGSGDDTSFFSDLINFTRIIPPTVFQILVGIYLVETVMLLSVLASGVESGFDKVNRDVTIGKNLLYAIITYMVLTIMGIIALQGLIESGIASTGA